MTTNRHLKVQARGLKARARAGSATLLAQDEAIATRSVQVAGAASQTRALAPIERDRPLALDEQSAALISQSVVSQMAGSGKDATHSVAGIEHAMRVMVGKLDGLAVEVQEARASSAFRKWLTLGAILAAAFLGGAIVWGMQGSLFAPVALSPEALERLR